MSESPAEIRERIKEEELARGADPRVAEGRAKAAEMRAKHGLPIEPEAAWRAKAGGGSAPVAIAPSPVPAQELPTPPAPAAEVAAAEVSDQAAVAASESQTEAVTPSTEAPSAQAEPVPAPSIVDPVPTPSLVLDDLDIGERLEVEQDEQQIGGVRVRDGAIPRWVLVVLLIIPLWAMLYLLSATGDDVARRTTRCEVAESGLFECFLPDEPEEGFGGH